MAKLKPAAFVSYTKANNEYLQNRIHLWCGRLQEAVRYVGEPEFELYEFLDGGKTLPTGCDWDERLASKIDESTFFIAMMTPGFFQSKECRKEALRFLGREEELNRQVFILPLLLENCSTAPYNEDGQRLYQRLSKLQRDDWTSLLHCPHDHEDVRKKIHTLARGISDTLAGYRKAAPVVVPEKAKPAAEEPRIIRPTRAEVAAVTRNPQGFEEVTWEKDGAVMVRIPAGAFKMGSDEYDDEKPVHEVYLDEYLMDKYPVTNAQYRRFCAEQKKKLPPDPGFKTMPGYFTDERWDNFPVVNVSWEDAVAYCEWAGKRLPTEAEWEKAARGLDVRKYPWGNEEPDRSRCNFFRNEGGPSAVDAHSSGASPYGLLDMAGNVWEWCEDWHDSTYYAQSQRRNPRGPSSGLFRVLRGGSWYNGAGSLRCAYRSGLVPSVRRGIIGFRCAVQK